MVNDPISDFLARIKNAISARQEKVVVPASKMLVKIAEILKSEGFIADYEVAESALQNELTITLRFVNGVSVIRDLVRASKPGRRVYRGYREMDRVKDGYGVAIISTSQGVVTDKQARKLQTGGEYLCYIY